MHSLPASSVSSSLNLLRRSSTNPRASNLLRSPHASPEPYPNQRPTSVAGGGRNAGIRLEERIELGSERTRVDSWISSRIQGVSRARIQMSIRAGLVTVNGRKIDKVSQIVRGGDEIICMVSELQPLRAEPEDIPLDIVYEDAHVLVVNKPAHMVVHPAPGNANGTLVNAVLHHCSLPACINDERFYEGTSEFSDDEIEDFSNIQFSTEEVIYENTEAPVRPGIVHRLDKGTSGLLVVAKDEHSHAQLAEQFKMRTIHRVYVSLTSGVPSTNSGRVEIPIARDPNNRIRMFAVSGSNNSRNARYAASSVGSSYPELQYHPEQHFQYFQPHGPQ